MPNPSHRPSCSGETAATPGAGGMPVNKNRVVHKVFSRLGKKVLPAYAHDDGPLTVRQVVAMRNAATRALPQGKLINRSTLF